MMGLSFVLVAGLFILGSSTHAKAEGLRMVPDVKLKVTYQPKENGRVKGEYHVLDLTCVQGACELTHIVINRCTLGSTTPGAIVRSTDDGDLKVEGREGFLQLEYSENVTGTVQLEFRYKPDGTFMPQMTGFRGGFVGPGVFTEGPFVQEFVPLHGDDDRPSYPLKEVTLDCAIELPAIPLAREDP